MEREKKRKRERNRQRETETERNRDRDRDLLIASAIHHNIQWAKEGLILVPNAYLYYTVLLIIN